MFGRLRPSSQPQSEPKIVPLSAGDFARLAPRDWNYPYGDVVSSISASPELSFRVERGGEYIVGGRWRRRREIGSVEYLRARGNRRPLLLHLEEQLRSERARLLVVGTSEQTNDLGFYLGEGFELIDEIVRYQRQGTRVDGREPIFPIRPLTPQDRPGLVAVDHASFPWLWWNSEEEFSWYLDLPGVEAHVALDETRVIGYTGFTITGQQGHLDRLAVHPDYQGRGVGADLVRYTLACMARHRVDRVALTTQVDNFRSANLYRALGFVRTTIHYPLYGRWLNHSPDG